jgi:hypothetical protein
MEKSYRTILMPDVNSIVMCGETKDGNLAAALEHKVDRTPSADVDRVAVTQDAAGATHVVADISLNSGHPDTVVRNEAVQRANGEVTPNNEAGKRLVHIANNLKTKCNLTATEPNARKFQITPAGP